MKSVMTDSGMPEGVAVALPEGGNNLQKGVIGNLPFYFSAFYSHRIKPVISQSPAARRNLIFFALALGVVISPHLGHATDLMATQKADANDTFGHGSTVEWVLYVAEIIVSVTGFIKTRNPMVFAGLIMLILITRAFFALIN
ncbi:type IV conjugative transfer system pilin TraA [Rahnella aquatilis]|nr:type IV conjugative transfer system pilin TraA [Rahnella aquatilis]